MLFLNCYAENFSINAFRKAYPASDLEDFMREFSKGNDCSISIDVDKAKTIINVLEDGEALENLEFQDDDQPRIEALYHRVKTFWKQEKDHEAAGLSQKN